ncbi:hypothetical protein [Ruegeria sp. HKCCA5426]|uniref:hypothetical protein n=1 Tax=Ruegeria sp. HKCCA5426 TaxID=2682985 RepID=UPI001487C066|nr:hypothetical protein [Ruegeria sp. HKCCA5426]
MKKLIVHIGSPKTGTTAIQNALANARETLKSSGVVYPRGLINRISRNEILDNHNEILDVIIRDPKNWGRSSRLLYGDVDSERLKKTEGSRFLNELKGAERVVLSAELLFGYRPDDIGKFFDLCRECGFQQPLVVAFLREPVGLYVSMAQQVLRGSAALPPPSGFRMNYCGSLGKWTKRENTQLEAVAYDSVTDVVNHFGQLINEHMDTQVGGKLKSLPNMNKSISAEAMILLQDYQKRFRAKGENRVTHEVNELVEVFRSLNNSSVKQSKPQAKPWVTAKINEINRDEIEALSAKFEVTLPYSPPATAEAAPVALDESALDVRDILCEWSPKTLNNLIVHSLHELASNAGTKADSNSRKEDNLSTWARNVIAKVLRKSDAS